MNPYDASSLGDHAEDVTFFRRNSGHRASFLPVAGDYLVPQDALCKRRYCLSTVASSCEVIEQTPGARNKP